MHGFARDAQSLRPRHRIEPLRQLPGEALRFVHVGRAEPADGLVEQFTRGFVPYGLRPVGDLGAQPGDPDPGRQIRLAPPRPGPGPDVGPQPAMKVSQGQRRLRRTLQRARQRRRERGLLGTVAIAAGGEAFFEADETESPQPRILMPEETPQDVRWTAHRIEVGREPVRVGAA